MLPDEELHLTLAHADPCWHSCCLDKETEAQRGGVRWRGPDGASGPNRKKAGDPRFARRQQSSLLGLSSRNPLKDSLPG